MSHRIKRVLVVLLVLVLVIVLAFVMIVGPWPTYGPGDVTETKAYRSAVEEIDKAPVPGLSPGPLQAGWSAALFNLPPETPLAGFGDRGGAPATGVRDPIYARAIAFSDGTDKLVIIGCDLLIVPENVADRVREQLRDRCNPSEILFNATHTHSGPGGWAPGLAASLFGGAYDPAVERAVADAMVKAATGALDSLAPAEIASTEIAVPEFVRNRAREADVDPGLGVLAVRRPGGERATIVSYAAHATILGSGNLEYSGDYPGRVIETLERETGGFGMFLAGAMGSTSANIGGPDDATQLATLGDALATHALDWAKDAEYESQADVAAIGVPFDSPSHQFRLNQNWRLSPHFVKLLGIDQDGWLHAARIGEVLLYATPADMSGEIALDWKAWADKQDIELWVLSFNGDYLGYVSPDRYYATAERGTSEEYEMLTMSWMGPNQEAFFTKLLHYLVPKLMP